MKPRIISYAAISTQQPLDGSFFNDPKPCLEPYCRAVEADYRNFIPMPVSRRMGAVLKRAVATTVTALERAGVKDPEAIVFGTGLGCIENTEKFLTAMVDNGESCLQPTHFINSTHNTIASQVATFLKCHGYNSTYAHLGISFESALMDVLMQFELGGIRSAVAGAHDEMTPTYHKLFDKVDYWLAPMGECAVSFVLSDEGDGCTLADVDLAYGSSPLEAAGRAAGFLRRNGVGIGDIGCVITGRNGDVRFDGSYDLFLDGLFDERPAEVNYKHVFGESFCAGAYGMMLGVESMRSGHVPSMYLRGERHPSGLDNILLINSFKDLDWSLILLRK